MDTGHKYLVSEKHKFIFYEIQKCGTQSMIKMFEKNSDLSVVRHLVVDKNLPDVSDYYKFAFVRNPWHRLWSSYLSKFVNYNKHPTLPGIRDKNLYMNMPFEDFVSFVCKTSDNRADVHFKSQHRFIPEGCKVGFMENFSNDMKAFMNEMGIHIETIPHINNTNSDDWRSKYTDEMRDMIAERYAEDIKRFNFTFN
ncbi:MAG: sulfotransferase family 2 domain-containing protein [Thiomicrorhabdus sp.]|jgi:chondroitin 4-sulfotransferase 11|nr:sulfotransferase family 2 domain-containing protein [Thiomicrorhabdus sp.]